MSHKVIPENRIDPTVIQRAEQAHAQYLETVEFYKDGISKNENRQRAVRIALAYTNHQRRLRFLARRKFGAPPLGNVIFWILLSTPLTLVATLCAAMAETYSDLFIVAAAVTPPIITLLYPGVLLFYPSNRRLRQRTHDLRVHAIALADSYKRVQADLRAYQKESAPQESYYQQLQGVLNDIRYKLLHESQWEGLKGREFEVFLIEVFSVLGYVVRHTAGPNECGADFIAEKCMRRIAVQAKGGYARGVRPDAIQQAMDGKVSWNCHEAFVITNSMRGFAESARREAKTYGCRLIAGGDIQHLILGRLL